MKFQTEFQSKKVKWAVGRWRMAVEWACRGQCGRSAMGEDPFRFFFLSETTIEEYGGMHLNAFRCISMRSIAIAQSN